MMGRIRERLNEGGPGSGFFGHAGRPGQVGGSVSGSGVEAKMGKSETGGPTVSKKFPEKRRDIAREIKLLRKIKRDPQLRTSLSWERAGVYASRMLKVRYGAMRAGLDKGEKPNPLPRGLKKFMMKSRWKD